MSSGPFWHRQDTGPVSKDDPLWSEAFREVWMGVSYKEGYGILLARDQKSDDGRFYYQVECDRPDSFTGEVSTGRGGKAYLSPHMTVSELTRLVFGLFKAYEEHECREFFKWKGRSIYGPHISSEALWSIANQHDYRD